MAIDRLLAHPWLEALVSHPARVLFQRPTDPELPDHSIEQPGVGDELALFRAAPVVEPQRQDAPIASQLGRIGVMAMVAPQFAEDRQRCRPSRRAFSSELRRMCRQRSILRRSSSVR